MTNNEPAATTFAPADAYALHPITHNCNDCHDYAGWENTHQDDDHEGDSMPDPDCRVCQHDVPRPLRAKATRVTGQPHINHSACYEAGAHDKNREGRELCRTEGRYLQFRTND
jgi:hypothetical protein